MIYELLRTVHIGAVVLSISLFVLRGVWMLLNPVRLQARWVRVVPHVVDTVLLASAIALAVTIGQYPFVQPWLTAKVLALIAYIILGSIAIKRGRTKAQRSAAFVAALVVFGYIVLVARAHSPIPYL